MPKDQVDPNRPPPGTSINRPFRPAPKADPGYGYVLESPIGKGGYGEVWRATAPGGKRSAIKFVELKPSLYKTEFRSLELFRDVAHPHLVTFFGHWHIGEYLVIAMELADGSLLDKLAEYRHKKMAGIPREELLDYLEESAKGIDYLNEPRHVIDGQPNKSIRHRDIKPGNLLLVGGCVKVADFGLARMVNHDMTAQTGVMTVLYAAPECFMNKLHSTSDQYALACTYCELLTSKLPFMGNHYQVVMGHMKGVPDLSMLPEADRPVVLRALDKDPAQRWPSCREFVKALRSAAAAKPAAPAKPAAKVFERTVALDSDDIQRVVAAAGLAEAGGKLPPKPQPTPPPAAKPAVAAFKPVSPPPSSSQIDMRRVEAYESDDSGPAPNLQNRVPRRSNPSLPNLPPPSTMPGYPPQTDPAYTPQPMPAWPNQYAQPAPASIPFWAKLMIGFSLTVILAVCGFVIYLIYAGKLKL